MAKAPAGQSCGTCRYSYVSRSHAAHSELRGCRRYPPMIQGSADARADPTVGVAYWCGEYAPADPETVEEGAATMARLVLLGDMTAARALADKLKGD